LGKGIDWSLLPPTLPSVCHCTMDEGRGSVCGPPHYWWLIQEGKLQQCKETYQTTFQQELRKPYQMWGGRGILYSSKFRSFINLWLIRCNFIFR